MSPISSNINLPKRQLLQSVEFYLEGIKRGDISILGQAITLLESRNSEHRNRALELLDACIPHSGKSKRIGITGVPGVGKSTFIEAFGVYLIEQGHKPAVLAVDPSSSITKGSILGDKTRMLELSKSREAFIRPSPSMGSLGGVSRATRESIILCEAAGFDVILVETVGVGQSETEVHSMVDFFLLLMLANAGDELQGIKRGIMEMADLIVINKADGSNLDASKKARREYKNALHLFPPHEYGWIPDVSLCSSIEKTGLKETWDKVCEYFDLLVGKSLFEISRQEQLSSWFDSSIDQQLKDLVIEHEHFDKLFDQLRSDVKASKLSPSSAASILVKKLLRN